MHLATANRCRAPMSAPGLGALLGAKAMPDVTFAMLSFEGPDGYSHAGGLGSRVTDLSRALAQAGFETHLFFIGAPDLPGYEVQENGRLHLHRWCQWISRYHPGGVYDGEEGKLHDWNRSLPNWLVSELVRPRVSAGGSVAILAEEWHTVGSIMTLHDILCRLGLRNRVKSLWNANNTFGFDRIPFDRLSRSAAITTVSRYMKHVMWRYRVDARVIPNGIADQWLHPVDRGAACGLRKLLRDRLTLVKVARWDPDKRWDMAVEAVAFMKGPGLRPLFLARGGVEHHGEEVIARARRLDLRLAFARWAGNDGQSMVEAIRPLMGADMIILENFLSEEQRRTLFRVADAVLANSGVEPFGLVGLETMAVGGIAFVGCTGEDYVTHRQDAISLQSSDPREIVHQITYLKRSSEAARRLRRAARCSAARYTWASVIRRVLLPLLQELGIDFGLRPWFDEAVSLRHREKGVDVPSTVKPTVAAIPPVVIGQGLPVVDSVHGN